MIAPISVSFIVRLLLSGAPNGDDLVGFWYPHSRDVRQEIDFPPSSPQDLIVVRRLFLKNEGSQWNGKHLVHRCDGTQMNGVRFTRQNFHLGSLDEHTMATPVLCAYYGDIKYQLGNISYITDKYLNIIVLLPGQEKCILVAHDWGGAVAIRFADQHPAMLEKLVLLNIPHYKAFEKHINSSLSQLWKSW